MTDAIPPIPPDAPSSDEKLWVILSHLSGFVGFPIIIPLIVYLVKKDESTYVGENAKEALNFHISLFLYAIPSVILCIVVIGVFMLMALGLMYVVLSIVATIKSAEGLVYRYPLTLRLVK